ncbi:hypothetical protein ACWOFR_01000 [Carnobacterium gallinarum]|uniref:hypothetical protein n=1 Tax=Carnobacterium gallinarum TaxID=2749 RepID=UPI00054D1B52|nr:hypothetical protein [Carnobacterium gallinarum]
MDFEYELKKVQREIEQLGEDVSATVRQSLEDVLNWAKAGYQKQALREQLKSEFQRTISSEKERVTKEWCQESSDSVTRAKIKLEDAFSSKSGTELQEEIRKSTDCLKDSQEAIQKFKQSFKSSNWI